MPIQSSQTRLSRSRSAKKHTAKVPAFTFACHSLPHEGRPERNEDAMLADRLRGLVAVFDGVGGSSAGAVASQLGAHVIRRAWKRTVQQQRGTDDVQFLRYDELDIEAVLQRLVEEAQAAISDEGERRAKGAETQQEADNYPATTIVLAALCQHPAEQGYIMGFAHAGDSRIYLLRPGEPIQRLTQDDGYFLLKIQDQTLSADDALRIDQATQANQLTETEREIFSKRNGITQALGHATPKAPLLIIHTDQTPIFPGDRVLLCSDGIHDNLTDAEIETILRHKARTTLARRLVEHARARSKELSLRAKQDDMTAIVITYNN